MNTDFAQGHRQLFDTGCAGLGNVWRRAAEEAAREACAPARVAPAAVRVLAAVLAAVVLAVVLGATLTRPADIEAAVAGTVVPAAPRTPAV